MFFIAAFKNLNGSSITFPLQGSTYSVLGFNTETGDKELLSIALDLPIEQPAEYDMSGDLNKKNLEMSLDYLTRLIQINQRVLSRTVQLPEGSVQTMQEFIDDLMLGNYEAKKWANYMEGTVDGYNYSAKYHAVETAEIAQNSIQQISEQGEDIIQRATEQADLAEAYAEKVEFGMQWTSFTTNNWTLRNDGKYQLIISDLPLVNAVYSGEWDEKKVCCGVDIMSTGEGSILISLNPFKGYALSASHVLGNYVHTQDLVSDEWVIQHNLGKIPCITLLDTDNIEMVGTIEHQTFNKCVITFANPVAGKAYLR